MKIQFVIFCSIILVGLLLIIKSAITNKHIKISITLGVVCILVGLTGVVGCAIYNRFCAVFQTPEEAFDSTHRMNEIICTLEGKDSAFVYSKDHDSFECSMLPKVENGWKAENPMIDETVILNGVGTITVQVYQYGDSNDYYVEVVDFSGKEMMVFDNRDSDFHSYNYTVDIIDMTCYIYLAYVNDFGDDYVLTVGDVEIPITDDENAIKHKF